MDEKAVVIDAPTKEQIAETVRKVQEMQAKIQQLTEEERFFLCDSGYFNDTIRGYLIQAMKNADFSKEDIDKALGGLRWAFDDISASEAAEKWRKW